MEPNEVAEPNKKKVLSLAEFLATPKDKRPKVLLEEEVELEVQEVILTASVIQLTKTDTEDFTKRVHALSPQVPLVDVPYTMAHRDPLNPNKIRPAGSYKERDDKDPVYLKEVQEWFTTSCIWLALYSSAAFFGVTWSEPDAFVAKFEELSREIPGPILLRLATAAARVNPGITLADELVHQEQERELQRRANEELALYEAELARQDEEARAKELEALAGAPPASDAPASSEAPPPVPEA